MKFKALFVTFNIVLIVSFLTIILLPFFLLDGPFMLSFWQRNWYFGAIFVVVLAIVNGIFLSQWKMLSCLEREDWPALARHLENRIVSRKRFSKRSVRLYIDALILLGDFQAIERLCLLLKTDKPTLFASFSSRFAAAAILSGDYEKAHGLATDPVEGIDPSDAQWRAFYASFSRHLGKRFDEAADGLIALAVTANDPLVAVLSGYLCESVLVRNLEGRRAELLAAAGEAKLRICAVFTESRWKSYVEEAKVDMQVVVLGKLIAEASSWLFLRR